MGSCFSLSFETHMFPGWPPTCSGSGDSLELTILLPLPRRGWELRCAPPHLVHARDLLLDRHRPNTATPPALRLLSWKLELDGSVSQSWGTRGAHHRAEEGPSAPCHPAVHLLSCDGHRSFEDQKSQEFAAFVLQSHLTTLSLRQEEMTHV